MRRLAIVAIIVLACAALSSPALAWAHGVVSHDPPEGVIVAGWEDNHPLYLCRAPYADGLHPGKVVGGMCMIGYGGAEQAIPNFEWGLASGFWASPTGGLANPLIGGQENGQARMVCKARYIDGAGVDRGWHPGKVINGNCNITWGGSEIPIAVFRQFYLGNP